MSLGTAVAAFAQRGAQRRAVWIFVAYSALLTALLVAVAAWSAPTERFGDAQLVGDVAAIDPSLWKTLALADVLALVVLAALGFVIAPALVAAAVTQERRAGTLDQLRTTPLSPLGLALGFIVGVPARLYLLCIGPLALHVVATLAGAAPLGSLLASLGLIAVGTATSCALALCLALAPRQESLGPLAALLMAAALGGFAILVAALADNRHHAAWAFWHPAGGLSSLMLAAPTLWRRIVEGPWYARATEGPAETTLAWVPLLSLSFALVVGALLLRAACRKLRAPALPLLSKQQALSLFALAAAGLLLPWSGDSRLDLCDAGMLTLALLLPMLALGLLATPTFEAWALALRRGGRTRWSADDAAPHRLIWAMQALWLALLVGLRRHDLAAQIAAEPSLLWLGWALWTALTLPIYLLFLSTRYASTAARGTFGVALLAHLVTQLSAIGMVAHRADDLQTPYGLACALAAVMAPAWLLWRQQALARRTLRGGT
jgi:hypothetical protein